MALRFAQSKSRSPYNGQQVCSRPLGPERLISDSSSLTVLQTHSIFDCPQASQLGRRVPSLWHLPGPSLFLGMSLATCYGKTHVWNGTFQKEREKLKSPKSQRPRPQTIGYMSSNTSPPKLKTHITSDRNPVVILRRKTVYLKAVGWLTKNLQQAVKTSQLVCPTPPMTKPMSPLDLQILVPLE